MHNFLLNSQPLHLPQSNNRLTPELVFLRIIINENKNTRVAFI